VDSSQSLLFLIFFFFILPQLEYVEKQIEIEANERAAKEQLNAVRKQVNLNVPMFFLSLFEGHI